MEIQNLKRVKFLPCEVCAFFLLLLLVACANEPKLPTAEEAKTAVLDKITMAAEKWANDDPMGYYECAAKDIVWIDDLGALKPISGSDALKTYLESFKGQVPKHECKIVDPVFQNYGDIVVVTYRYQGIVDGEPVSPWKVTSVYRYENAEWLSVHENWSEVSESVAN